MIASSIFVISVPARGVDHRGGVRVAVQREHAVGRAVVNDGVGVLGGRDPAEHLKVFRSNMTTD